jgi:hypothetical protein
MDNFETSSYFSEWKETYLFGSILAKLLDSKFVSGKVSLNDHSGFRVLFHPGRVDVSDIYQPAETSIVIDKFIGRFGNNVLQLRSAYLLARVLGAQSVIAPEHEYFRSVSSKGISIYFGMEHVVEQSVAIVGEFFPIPFNYYHEIFGEQNIVDFYHQLKTQFTLNAEVGLTEKDLVLFIRSGDVFTLTHDVLGYGQPPLSFYQLLIELERPERIFVLSEDDKNPVVSSLLNGEYRNIQLIRRGMTGDFEFMLGAKKIGTGTTTLLPNLLNLSEDIKLCYSFDDALKSFDGRFTNAVITDVIGDYKKQIMNNNWVHSPEQLKLMINYPLSHLELKKPFD